MLSGKTPRLCLWLGIVLSVCLQRPAQGWADTIHLHNGQVIQGKLLDVTGDIIRFRTNNGGSTSVHRLEVLGRQDRVDLRGKKTLNGEVMYVDGFKLELQTDKGRVRVWRLMVKDVALGQ